MKTSTQYEDEERSGILEERGGDVKVSRRMGSIARLLCSIQGYMR